MVKVVGVFGLSGVGKTWLISRFVRCGFALHVQASQLLKAEKAVITGQAVSSEALRTDAVLDNQSLLIRSFVKVLSSAKWPIVFDGHSVIDNGNSLIEIPTEVVRALSVSGIIYIQDTPAAIVARRAYDKARARPTRSEAEIEIYQNVALAKCSEYANHLEVGLHLVAAGDEPAFRSAIGTILGE